MSAIAAHVLVLEDDDGLLALATRVLRKQGHRVTAMADAVSALASVQQERPDLLIVDYHLQALETGLDFFRQLRASGLDIPAIMVSGVSDDALIIEALRTGVADVLPKTSDYLDYLPAAVERLLQQQALQRLAEAERMAHVREEFVAALAQEFRAPLNTIIGWTQYLLRDATDGQQVRKGLEVIERNARLQAQRVEQLLELSRIMAGKLHVDMQPVDMVRVVEQAIAAVHAVADARQIHIHAVVDTPAPILGDPARLQQVVGNLLAHVIRSTPPQGHVQVILRQKGGQVELELGQALIDAGQANAPERVGDDDVEVDLAGESGVASGLSLAIARQLAELHAGRMHAEGLGPGVRFLLTLPLTTPT